MLKTSLTDSSTKKQLRTQKCWDEQPVLMTGSYGAMNGHFKSETLSAAGSVNIVTPFDGNGIVLTDLILTTDKTTGSAVTVKITDGVNEITLIEADMANAPVNIAISFRGLWSGWRSAGVELEIVGGTGPTATLAIGYFHIPESKTLQFSDWDAQRL